MSSDSGDESKNSNIKFMRPDDKVVSEVNPFLVSKSTVKKPLQKVSNLIATITFNVPSNAICLLELQTYGPDKSAESSTELVHDDDGDLVLSRTAESCSDKEFLIYIEYENATTLDLVGLQIWRGAFLLSDFVMHNASRFQGKNILELGSGTGLVGLVASLFAKHVVLTDLNVPAIMDLLRANITHNKHIIGHREPSVLPLDFMAATWSQELTNEISFSDVVVVADVIYHVEITDAFIRTLKKILLTGENLKEIFIALEKRYVFTLSDMDAVAPMHNHFLEELDKQLDLSPGCLPRPLSEGDGRVSKLEISMSCVPLDFKQYFNYDRCKELVLYQIISRPTRN